MQGFEWIDELFEEGENAPSISYGQKDQLHQLLSTSSICNEKRQMIEAEIEYCEVEDYYALYFYLKNNQTDPITSGRNYSQTDIKQHLTKITGDD